jgi:23S rRNA (cytosine1962-C5)-methyltransferase
LNGEICMLPILHLKKDEERRLLAGHLWIYSNEIDVVSTPLKNFQPGDLVYIETQRGKKLGVGYVNPKTLLSARLLSRNVDEIIDQAFFEKRFQNALNLRQLCFSEPFYRLVFGESDQLPGLIIDRFDDIFVVQISTSGMERFQEVILEALITKFNPKGVLWKNDVANRELEGLPQYVKIAFGNVPDVILLYEDQIKFFAPLTEGQKTGWFYDQRNNRARLSHYVKNKSVLDVFSYVGGFGICAAVCKARDVLCVDSSRVALDLLTENARENQVSDRVSTLLSGAFSALKQFVQDHRTFDVIILDPPALIKKRKDMQEGIVAYQRLNALALSCLNPNGILLTASCSMHLSKDQLLNVVRKASLKTRDVVVLETLHQAQDHPIHPAICETDYLKGFVLMIRH